MKAIKFTAKDIAWILARSLTSPVYARRQLVVVPNVSYGIGLNYEADILAVSPSRYMTEIEIKVSVADWKADIKKRKWLVGGHHRIKPRRFFYALPLELAQRISEVEIPDHAGVLGCSLRTEGYNLARVEEIRPAQVKIVDKIIDADLMKLYRLMALRVWPRKMPEKLRKQWEVES